MAHQIPQPHPQTPAEGQQLKKDSKGENMRKEKRRVKKKRRKRDRNK